MLRARTVCAGIAALLALALAAALLPNAPTAAADSGDAITTELQPGLNLAGWTQPETPVAAIFDAIPRLIYVYAWDPDDQWFRWATLTASGVVGDLEVLTPGMGLWLDVGGEEAFAWTRPFIPQTGLASLREGWNLIVWAGDSGVAASYALRHLDGIVAATLNAASREPATLTRGGAFWLKAAAPKQWWQLNDPPRIEFVGHFSPESKEQLRAQVDDVIAFFVRRFGLAVPDLTIRYATAGTQGMVCGGYAAKVIYLKEPCFRAVAHEYSHAVQEMISRNRYSPAWIVEGVANRWSAQFYDSMGSRSYESHFRSTVIRNSKLFPVPLSEMDSHSVLLSESGGYSVAHLAIDHLAGLSGEETLVRYFAQRPAYPDWRVAFSEVFGLSTEAFYESFEEYRLEVAPPSQRFSGIVTGPHGKPLGDIGIAVQTRLLDRTTVHTGADGAFTVLAPRSLTDQRRLFVNLGCVYPTLWVEVGRIGNDGRFVPTNDADDGVVASPSGMTDIAISLLPSACLHIRGDVRVRDGAPLNNLSVRLSSVGSESTLRTDAGGIFNLRGQGQQTLSIYLPPWRYCEAAASWRTVGRITSTGAFTPAQSLAGISVEADDIESIRIEVPEASLESC